MTDPRPRLRKIIEAFDEDVAAELATDGERADLWGDVDIPIDLLREIEASLRGEPVAWLIDNGHGDRSLSFADIADADKKCGFSASPLFASPPAARDAEILTLRNAGVTILERAEKAARERDDARGYFDEALKIATAPWEAAISASRAENARLLDELETLADSSNIADDDIIRIMLTKFRASLSPKAKT